MGNKEMPVQKDEAPLGLSALVPGDVIELSDITALSSFEDMVAKSINPDYDREAWSGRKKLRDIIRPDKFNGTIADIKLIVMADPYERLLDARERGLRGASGFAVGRTHELPAGDPLLEKYMGFSLIATPRSSRPGDLGQIQAELWYSPLNDPYEVRTFGKAISRVVTKPKIEKEKFIELNKSSRRVAFQLSRQRMMNPMQG